MTPWMIARPVVRLLPLLLLAACAVPSAAERARLDSMIGQSEAALLRSYGVPTRSYATGGGTFLAYEQSSTEIDPGFGGFDGFGPGGFGPYGGFGGFYGEGFGGVPTSVQTLTCQTTFEVAAGKVAAWSLHGDGC